MEIRAEDAWIRDSRLVGVATELGREGLEEWLHDEDLSFGYSSFGLLVLRKALASDVSMYSEFVIVAPFVILGVMIVYLSFRFGLVDH